MIYYNYNPYLLYLQKHDIYYYRNGGLIIKGKGGLKRIKKIERAIRNTSVGKKIDEILKTDSYYIRLLNEYNNRYKELSVNDFIESIDGRYNDVDYLTFALSHNNLVSHKNPRIKKIAQKIDDEIYAKVLMTKAILLYREGKFDEGRKILDEISDIRNTDPKYLEEFEEELSKAFNTQFGEGYIIRKEDDGLMAGMEVTPGYPTPTEKEQAIRTKRQEAARKGLETRKRNLEERKKRLEHLNELSSEFGTVIDSNDPVEAWKFRNKYLHDDIFKNSDLNKMSSDMISELHDTYYNSKIRSSEDINLLLEYLSIYPEGKYVGDVNAKISKLLKAEEANSKINELNKQIEELRKNIDESNKAREEALNATKKKHGILASIKRHPWRTTAIIGTGVTLGGGILGGLYLASKGIGEINKAEWEFMSGIGANDTITVNQQPVLEQSDTIQQPLNNGKSITSNSLLERLNASKQLQLEILNAN